MQPGTLYVVGVPIGNLEDITLRALRILREAALIACEDTRRTAQLLSLLGIERPKLLSVHDHNEAARVPYLLEQLRSGQSVVLVSDAGTPAISDPGYKLVRAAIDHDLPVVPIPGPSALIVALCAAGLPTDRFHFIGFVSSKAQARKKQLLALADGPDTLVFYESPHRLEAFLQSAQAAFGGERQAVIARELTKRFETFQRGSLDELVADPGVVRGEVVVLIEGARAQPAAQEGDGALEGVLRLLLAQGLSTSRAAKAASLQLGVPRREAYALALEYAAEGEAAEGEAVEGEAAEGEAVEGEAEEP